MDQRPRVIIIGAGFGGLFAAKTLVDQPVEVLLIDRDNYHTFTPLLYQVATSALDPSEIAHPIRSIFAGKNNIRCLMGEVTGVDPGRQVVEIAIDGSRRQESFDYLILSTGSTPDFFGKEYFRKEAFPLRTLEDAVQLRNHILKLFEKAAWTLEESEREALTTFVVIGGGPTGLETAGALYELYNHVLKREYQGDLKARVYLVEMRNHLLDTYSEKLQKAALDQIHDLGVSVVLGKGVREINSTGVSLDDGSWIPARTVVWAAGVKGLQPIGLPSGLKAGRNQIRTEATLQVPEHPGIYAVGDTAYLEREDGRPHPMMIPVAKQQGIQAAENILRAVRGQPQETFSYHDRGVMATIGRRRAVAWIYYRLALTGYPAWLTWLGLHLISLIGFRNQLNVLVNWIWNYLTYDRSVRVILD
ncbi:MAG: NAD(P)/FAD-dependent oxidoreductase [Anaerolineales bacterium]|nr:NAD(P)/FAD-dependent oxidoreductase [Anaerolineales bacterium]